MFVATKEQMAALNTLAQAHGLKAWQYRGQVAIGANGYRVEVLYTPARSRGHRWDVCRGRNELAAAMARILGC